ncbi:MAG: hypothetical protein GWN55_17005 [Phycisphaerae bacterium]|nr:hypothetical protein [Phycisphaerae bacterium]NIR68208.1 hypothetical protein [candidate division Zixibacteria bacterium]NIW50473.1 hypothetical protein [Gammaproteobacteria bacterium]NIP55919.1 hypothetical protein [Phycisphaerae bacterium]NIS54485.1 hypothetical protein [Phycisphaerae bacterium]
MKARLTVSLGCMSLLLLCTFAQAAGPSVSDGTAAYVIKHWEREFTELEKQIKKTREFYNQGRDPYEGMRILDGDSRILPSDRTPFDVEYRRTHALIDLLEDKYEVRNLGSLRFRLSQMGKRIKDRPAKSGEPSRTQVMSDYFEAAALRRSVAMSNPLLNFDKILFVGRGNYYGDDPTGQHQLSGPLAFCNRVGGGLYMVKNFKTDLEIIDVLKNSIVEKGTYKGWKLSGKGSFYSPELSYDGKTILFSWSENRVGRERAGWGAGTVGPIHEWPPENVWHIFKVYVDGTALIQLTEGPWNDFDACFTPDGRIVFISERRGGYIRCFRKTLFMEPTNYVMHSMKADGSDITPISYFEASEWAPSVDNDGMLIYSRWDYIDRENGLGSKFWTCYPDGRNPRASHGNYPHPYSVQPEYNGPKEGTRNKGACSEVHFRAIPNSSKYIFTGVPHHGASFGPLALLDIRIRDEGTMNQIQVITADQKFPESQTREGIETDDRILKYGTPWPLSEDFYICNYVQDLILLDRMGTKTIICSHEQCPNIGETMRLVEPIPVQRRKKPQAIPVSTYEGQRAKIPHSPAVISVMNINVSDLPFPPDRPAKWMRIVQLFPKTTPYRDIPNTGYCNENIPRMSLGIVPVEEDGSVYCKAPVGKVLLFQALDSNKMGIQSMRSATFVHKGEHLTCVGCHEDKWMAPQRTKHPKAFQRPPSELIKEPGSQEPVTYYRTVKPIFDGKCLPCHKTEGKGLQNMGYDDLKEYAFYYSGAHMNNYCNLSMYGMGTRSIPGLFGAYYSKMGKALLKNHRGQRITEVEYRRVCLWLDLNSPRLGAYNDVSKQERGELVWPNLDVDPDNTTGVEEAFLTTPAQDLSIRHHGTSR